jgi:hypothetical protein
METLLDNLNKQLSPFNNVIALDSEEDFLERFDFFSSIKRESNKKAPK